MEGNRLVPRSHGDHTMTTFTQLNLTFSLSDTNM